jgi:hypothetical protein
MAAGKISLDFGSGILYVIEVLARWEDQRRQG